MYNKPPWTSSDDVKNVGVGRKQNIDVLWTEDGPQTWQSSHILHVRTSGRATRATVQLLTTFTYTYARAHEHEALHLQLGISAIQKIW